MPDILTAAMLWIMALSCGLMAGLYFAFSTFLMRALGRIEPGAGIAAMNAIDVDIQRSLFMPVFVGSPLIAIVLAGFAARDLSAPYSLPALVGGAIYVVGMVVVTMARNVPLNNALARVDPTSAEGAAFWARYLGEWTRWNHLRTLSSLAGCALYIRAIAVL